MRISELIERKRKLCSQKLREALRGDTLTRESYNRLYLFNNSLAGELLSAISTGRELLKNHIIDTIDELIDLVRVGSPTERRMEMFRLITGPLGRKNAAIRGTAATLGRAVLESKALDLSLEIIESHYELRGKSLDELTEDQMMEMRLSAEVAESIYQHVLYTKDYISERAEYLQPPLFTLKVVKGGDCDDLAILLCSLWESIGYETTLNFTENHCLPGVKLSIPIEREGRVKLYNVRADPTLKRLNTFRLSYDLCTGKFSLKGLPEKGQEVIRKLYKAKSYTVPPVLYREYFEVLEDE